MAPKTVLITGANRGIGFALTEHYKKEGWNVIACARNIDTADQLKILSPWKLIQLDTSDEMSIHQAAAALASVQINVLINNAGVFESCSLFMTSKKDMMHQFEVNAVGPFLMTRAFLPNLKQAAKRDGSAFVFQLSSLLGSISDNTFSNYYGYRASKTALNMINKSLALDLKDDSIGCVLLSPGYVATDMNSYNGTMTVEDSVTGMTTVIANATLADSGKLFEYDGRELPW